MPKVQDDLPQLSTNVPGVNYPYTREFGAVGRGLEDIGGAVEGAGANIYEKVQMAESQDQANNAYINFKVESAKKLQQLQVQSPDGYIRSGKNGAIMPNEDGTARTIHDEYRDWSKDQMANATDGLSGLHTKSLFKDRASSYLAEQEPHVFNMTQQMKVKSYDDGFSSRVQKLADDLSTNPDLNNFYSHYKDLMKDLNDQVGVTHNQTDAQEKLRRAGAVLGEGLMRGAYTQDLFNKKEGDPDLVPSILKWKQRVEGLDTQSKIMKQQGLPTLSDIMDPRHKASEDLALTRLIPQAKQQDMRNFEVSLKNAKDAAEVGGLSDESYYQNLGKLANYAQNKSMPENVAINHASDLIANKLYGDLLGDNFRLNMTPEQKRASIEQAKTNSVAITQKFAEQLGVNDPNLGYEAQKRIAGKLDQLYKNGQEALHNDFAGQIMSPPKTQGTQGGVTPSFAAARFAGQDFKDLVGLAKEAPTIKQMIHDMKNIAITAIPDSPDSLRFVSKDQSSVMGSVLTDTRANKTSTAAQFKGFLNAFGEDSPQVISTMIKDHSLPKSWALLANISPNTPQPVMESLVGAIKGDTEIDKGFKEATSVPGSKMTNSVLNGQIRKQLAPWAASQEISQADRGFLNRSSEVVTRLAKEMWLQDPTQDAKHVAEAAYNRFIGDFHHVTTIGPPGWWPGSIQSSYKMSIPKGLATENELDTIRSNLSHSISPKNLEGISPDGPLTSDGKPSPVQSHFVSNNVAPTAGWTFGYANGKPGFVMIYKIGGELKPLRKDGRRVFVDLEDAKRPGAGDLLGAYK